MKTGKDIAKLVSLKFKNKDSIRECVSTLYVHLNKMAPQSQPHTRHNRFIPAKLLACKQRDRRVLLLQQRPKQCFFPQSCIIITRNNHPSTHVHTPTTQDNSDLMK